MRGSALIFIIGMFAAAIVGIAATFAMQAAMPKNGAPAQEANTAELINNTLRTELAALES